MSTVLIAIDPGKSGGLAVLYPNSRIVLHPMPPTETDTMELLKSIRAEATVETWELEATIEKVTGFVAGGNSPGSHMFNFGRGVGVLMGVLMALGIPVTEVTAKAWQKKLALGGKGKLTDAQWKRSLLDQARKRHPAQDGLTQRTADALLILDSQCVAP